MIKKKEKRDKNFGWKLSRLLASVEVAEFRQQKYKVGLTNITNRIRKFSKQEKKNVKKSNETQQHNCLGTCLINVMVKIKFGINKHSQNFDGFLAYNTPFTQFLLKTKPVDFFLFGQGNNTCPVNIELHDVRNTAATYRIYSKKK
jgi:hypothetical protein